MIMTRQCNRGNIGEPSVAERLSQRVSLLSIERNDNLIQDRWDISLFAWSFSSFAVYRIWQMRCQYICREHLFVLGKTFRWIVWKWLSINLAWTNDDSYVQFRKISKQNRQLPDEFFDLMSASSLHSLMSWSSVKNVSSNISPWRQSHFVNWSVIILITINQRTKRSWRT